MIREWPTGTTELARGVFAYVQATGGFCIANAGLIVGRDGATSIDALFSPPMTEAFLAEVRRLSTAPLSRLINTHHHVDHTLGNALFPPETEIVAHARAKAAMEQHGAGVLDTIKRIAPGFTAELQGAQVRLPDTTFAGAELKLELDGRVVQLLHPGVGHTVGDVLVYLPDERVLFSGDVGFFYVTPLAFEGHIGNWIRVIHRVVAEIDADVIVPGHGPVGTKQDLLEMAGYLELIHGAARLAFDAGVSQREAVGSIGLGAYAEWGEAERIVPNVARLYQEFRGELDSLAG